MIHRVIACAAALSLSACMVVSIDETTVFEPIAYDEALAKQTGQTMIGERAFQSEADWFVRGQARQQRAICFELAYRAQLGLAYRAKRQQDSAAD